MPLYLNCHCMAHHLSAPNCWFRTGSKLVHHTSQMGAIRFLPTNLRKSQIASSIGLVSSGDSPPAILLLGLQFIIQRRWTPSRSLLMACITICCSFLCPPSLVLPFLPFSYSTLLPMVSMVSYHASRSNFKQDPSSQGTIFLIKNGYSLSSLSTVSLLLVNHRFYWCSSQSHKIVH